MLASGRVSFRQRAFNVNAEKVVAIKEVEIDGEKKHDTVKKKYFNASMLKVHYPKKR